MKEETMENDLISRSALLKKHYDLYPFCGHCDGYGYVPVKTVADLIKAAPTIEAKPVKVGNCEGCIWENRKRPQKCSCCRRNPDMKDCYEERKSDGT